MAYTLLDLGALGGRGESRAEAINGSGVTVGFSSTFPNVETHAFVNAGNGPQDLSPQASQAFAFGLSDSNPPLIAGSADGSATLWVQGSPVDLDPLLGNPSAPSEARDVNDAGLVACNAGSSAFRLDYMSGAKEVLGLPGAVRNMVGAMNKAGHVVGFSEIPSLRSGFFFDGTSILPLGLPPGMIECVPLDLNDADVIVGFLVPDTGHGAVAFRWDGGFQILPSPGTEAVATGINNKGDIVGYWTKPMAPFGSFVREGGNTSDLVTEIDPASGWELTAATSINDSGSIAGFGTGTSQNEHGFRLDHDFRAWRHWVGLYQEILFGIRQDGGGLYRSGRRVPPRSPLMSASERDALLGLAIANLARELSDERSRASVVHAGVETVRRALDGLIQETDGGK